MISIAIPVYEMNSSGAEFLKLSLSKICQQNFNDIEVVVSDHSKDDEIKNVCDTFEGLIKIVYLKNEEKRGSSSANLNNALKHCSGEIIKILMQDEYLYDEDALEKIKQIFDEDSNTNWLITSCVFGTTPDVIKGSMNPKYTEKIVNGINTIGSPSVLTIRNSNIEYFNEDLLWVMDCEYYKRLYDKFGPPSVLEKNCVFIVQHQNQVSSILSEEFKKNEVKLLEEKFK